MDGSIGPDFLLVGARFRDQVALYCSRDLADVSISNVDEDLEFLLGHSFIVPRPRGFDLTARLLSYVVVYGDTYEDAMRRADAHFASEQHAWYRSRPGSTRGLPPTTPGLNP
jgi:hypothetical protein